MSFFTHSVSFCFLGATEYCPRLTRQRASDEEDGLKARLGLGIYIIAVGSREDPYQRKGEQLSQDSLD
jgi:hypothetical protein